MTVRVVCWGVKSGGIGEDTRLLLNISDDNMQQPLPWKRRNHHNKSYERNDLTILTEHASKIYLLGT